MKKIQKTLICMTAVATTATVIAPLASYSNNTNTNSNNLKKSTNGPLKLARVDYYGSYCAVDAKLTKDNIKVYGEFEESSDLVLLDLGVDYNLYYILGSQRISLTNDLLEGEEIIMDTAFTWNFEVRSNWNRSNFIEFQIDVHPLHPVNPIGDNWFGAEVWCNESKQHFTTAKEAFEYINSDYIKKQDNVTFVLFDDWIADKNGSFGTNWNGAIYPEDRAKKGYKLTIDLNGFKVDGNRQGKNATNHAVFDLRQNGYFTIKNGTITGGKCAANGAGVYFDDNDCHVTLENVTITGNETVGSKEHNNNGGGLYIKNCEGTITLDNVTITDNKASGFGGGVYRKFDRLEDHTIILKNRITIKNNIGGAGRNNFTFQSHNSLITTLLNEHVESLSPASEIWFDSSSQESPTQVIAFDIYGREGNLAKAKTYFNSFHLDSNIHGRYVYVYQHTDLHDEAGIAA